MLSLLLKLKILLSTLATQRADPLYALLLAWREKARTRSLRLSRSTLYVHFLAWWGRSKYLHVLYVGMNLQAFMQCFLRTMNLRKYHGRVEFVPAPGHELYGEKIKDRGSNVASMNTSYSRHSSSEVLQRGYQGPTACFDHSEWRFLEGPFISVSLFNVPWVGEDAKPAPEAKFSDGFLDLAILKDCSKAALISLLLKMSDGSHVKSPYVMYLKVKAFRLVPGNRVENPKKGGIIDVDGEVIARGEGTYMHGKETDIMVYGPPIQLIVDQGLATIFTPI